MRRVISWDPAYRQAWYDLCYAWLDQYDLIEEEDLRILRDPYDAILNHGGQILLAVEDGALLGTLSLIPEGAILYLSTQTYRDEYRICQDIPSNLSAFSNMCRA